MTAIIALFFGAGLTLSAIAGMAIFAAAALHVIALGLAFDRRVARQGGGARRSRPCRDQSTSSVLAGEEFREGVLVIGMPARQRRAILDEIARRPKIRRSSIARVTSLSGQRM